MVVVVVVVVVMVEVVVVVNTQPHLSRLLILFVCVRTSRIFFTVAATPKIDLGTSCMVVWAELGEGFYARALLQW